MSFKEFQHGGHLENWNTTISAILNLCVTVQVSAQSDLGFRRSRLKNFKMAHGGHLVYRNGTILDILNLCVTVMPPLKFQLNRT